ncbi:K(+) efflux antiporter 2, chloroplastic-like isoform X1 [Olea europaea var. sylvestris]|uniref:K(+) efflux antiporter 2, chloroplastic-like isoform X1 n=1 Tax=Olea europaea var. sylvestris TaxID=158386 RepID=UPI000C1CE90C|nr:K(+) efflux antiporter 2, chloroplastic-like isoform X1 [Olea europaea var. sylvestris]
MDFAYSIYQPNVIPSGKGASCRELKQLNLTTGLKCNGLHWKVIGNPRPVSKAHSSKKLKKYNAYCGSTFSPRILINQLWCYGYDDSLMYNHGNTFKLSKHSGLLRCQGNDSLSYINGNGRDVEIFESGNNEVSLESSGSKEAFEEDKIEEVEPPSLDELRELLQKALKDLEVAQLNSKLFEEKAQKISEAAIALKDDAANARNVANTALSNVQEIVKEEAVAKEGVQKATMSLSLAESRLQVAVDSLEIAKEKNGSPRASKESTLKYENRGEESSLLSEEEKALLTAQEDISDCRNQLEICETELRRVKYRKEELQKEVDRLNGAAQQAEMNALKAEEDVANIMLLAEQAVAYELEAAQRVNDAELALQRVEKNLAISNVDVAETTVEASAVEEVNEANSADLFVDKDWEMPGEVAQFLELLPNNQFEESSLSDESDQENGKFTLDPLPKIEADGEKLKTAQSKKQEIQKEPTRESSPLSAPKALLKKSSRFFSASFFSFNADEDEFTPSSVFCGLVESARQQLPKLVFGSLLIGAGIAFYINRRERFAQQFQQLDIISTSIDEVSTSAKPLVRQIREFPQKVRKLTEMIPHQEISEEEASLFDMLWLLLASVIFVPIFQKIPGGSPVLGYLAAGILIGPYGVSIIRHVHGTKAIAEFGVVFLLFNIGLELSVERLSSMKKYVFGLGSAQVLATAAVVGLVAHFVAGQPGPASIVIGNGLALSSTAVVLQVLQERGESTSRHGRATFSVLLFQDLAVVVLLILIPLISPNSSKGGVGFQAIAEALGLAAVKAIVAITAIIAGGRLLLRPIYKQIAENQNAEIFSANTLLVILGTSLLTARAGLSMALGAFLAGLLLAETEFSLQVESDIAPYRGLLLGLFFMTVGMSIEPKLLVTNFPVVMGSLSLLIVGKTILVALIGRLFGISIVSAIRVGLLLAPGGEFAFVAFGEAVNQGIMSSQLSSLLFLVVGISMALTPYLAAGGQLIASRFELHDVRSLLPVESETDDLQDHIIICGFGRVGQIIAQLLSERLIPFVALDVRRYKIIHVMFKMKPNCLGINYYIRTSTNHFELSVINILGNHGLLWLPKIGLFWTFE